MLGGRGSGTGGHEGQCGHRTNVDIVDTVDNIDHTLSIWLEMEFISNIFCQKNQFALIIYTILLMVNKINSFITKSLRKLLLENISFKYCVLWNSERECTLEKCSH